MIVGIDASRSLRTQPTGTERYAFEIVAHLLRLPAATGHAWRLYTDVAPSPAQAAAFAQPRAEFCVLPARRFWTHGALAREIARRPPDVLFVPAHVVPWRLFGRRLPPTVVTVHDLGYYAFPESHTLAQRLYLDWSTRWSVAAATRVIAVSQATAKDVRARFGAAAGKVRVVHEAVAPRAQPDAAAVAGVRQRLGLARPYALYVGTLQPRKNLARLIEAYEQICAGCDPGWDLALAGGAGWLSEPILRQARMSAWAARIHVTGYVPEETLAPLLAGARFFAFPSLFEGFGLPVLEAQQLGVPVMTANNSALPEVAGDAALLVDPTDVDAIAAAMLRLSQDEALRQSLIAAGYVNIGRFSWEKAAAETLAVLEEAAGAAPAARKD